MEIVNATNLLGASEKEKKKAEEKHELEKLRQANANMRQEILEMKILFAELYKLMG